MAPVVISEYEPAADLAIALVEKDNEGLLCEIKAPDLAWETYKRASENAPLADAVVGAVLAGADDASLSDLVSDAIKEGVFVNVLDDLAEHVVGSSAALQFLLRTVVHEFLSNGENGDLERYTTFMTGLATRALTAGNLKMFRTILQKNFKRLSSDELLYDIVSAIDFGEAQTGRPREESFEAGAIVDELKLLSYPFIPDEELAADEDYAAARATYLSQRARALSPALVNEKQPRVRSAKQGYSERFA